MCFSLARLDDQLAEQVMEKYVTSEGEIFQARRQLDSYHPRSDLKYPVFGDKFSEILQ